MLIFWCYKCLSRAGAGGGGGGGGLQRGLAADRERREQVASSQTTLSHCVNCRCSASTLLLSSDAQCKDAQLLSKLGVPYIILGYFFLNGRSETRGLLGTTTNQRS